MPSCTRDGTRLPRNAPLENVNLAVCCVKLAQGLLNGLLDVSSRVCRGALPRCRPPCLA